MLPPNLEHQHTHEYGQLQLIIKDIDIPGVVINQIEPHFFGNAQKYQHKRVDKMPLIF